MPKLCWYCEEQVASMVRHEKPACDNCGKVDVRVIAPTKTDEDKAEIVKLALLLFRKGDGNDA